MKKLLLIILGLLLMGILLLSLHLNSRFSSEKLSQLLEKKLGCQVTLEKSKIRIWQYPSALQLHDLKLYKEEDSDQKDPLLIAKKISLQVESLALLSNLLNIQKLTVNEAAAQITIYEDGSNSWQNAFLTAELLKSTPELLAAQSQLRQASFIPLLGLSSLQEKNLSLLLQSIEIHDSQITVLSETGNHDLFLKDLNLSLKNLAQVIKSDSSQEASFDFNGRLLVQEIDTPEPNLNFMLSSQGSLPSASLPFLKLTAVASSLPPINFKLTVHPDSYASNIPMLSELNKANRFAKEFGLQLPKLNQTLKVIAPATCQLKFEQAVLSLESPLDLQTEQYNLEVAQGSWLEPSANAHTFRGNLILNEQSSAQALQELDLMLKNKLPNAFHRSALELAESKLLDKSGRLSLSFESKAHLSAPEVTVIPPFKLNEIVQEFLQQQGGIEGLFRTLLGK